MKLFVVLVTVLLGSACIWAQGVRQDKGVFAPDKNEFYERIKRELDAYYKGSEEQKLEFKMDFEGLDLPSRIDQFEYQWHNTPLSQGRTGSCWSFSATSFFESEIYRLSGKKIKLSEMYTVYWEYVEKARYFVRERGTSLFQEGSMLNAIPRIWTKYGIVPSNAYPGLPGGQPFHDHEGMVAEMQNYLESMQSVSFWNEDDILSNIKSILNYYMGEPPLKIVVDNVQMTPLEYLNDIVRINFNDYVDILSLKEQPYFQQVEYSVPDNWWHDSSYINLPLDEFMAVIKSAAAGAYTVAIGGDVSEAGYDSQKEVAMIPSFDIPAPFIDEDSRQLRFSNGSTTDDHGIHVIGMMQIEDATWYLIKDSGSGAQNGANKGYRFYHSDYIKLKILDIMVHRDVVKELLAEHGM